MRVLTTEIKPRIPRRVIAIEVADVLLIPRGTTESTIACDWCGPVWSVRRSKSEDRLPRNHGRPRKATKLQDPRPRQAETGQMRGSRWKINCMKKTTEATEATEAATAQVSNDVGLVDRDNSFPDSAFGFSVAFRGLPWFKLLLPHWSHDTSVSAHESPHPFRFFRGF